MTKYEVLKNSVRELSKTERDINGSMSEKYYKVLREFQEERSRVLANGGKIS